MFKTKWEKCLLLKCIIRLMYLEWKKYTLNYKVFFFKVLFKGMEED